MIPSPIALFPGRAVPPGYHDSSSHPGFTIAPICLYIYVPNLRIRLRGSSFVCRPYIIVLLNKEPHIVIFIRGWITLHRKILRLTSAQVCCAFAILAPADFRRFPVILISYPSVFLRFLFWPDQTGAATVPLGFFLGVAAIIIAPIVF